VISLGAATAHRGPTAARRTCLLAFLAVLYLLPASAADPAPIRFAVIGDSGTGGQHQHRIAQQMLSWRERMPYDLVLMLGDNIYGGPLGWGGGSRQDFEEKFDRPYAELLARGVVFRAALGNHDMRNNDGQDLIQDYDRFHIEGPQGYYSFTAGSWQPTEGEPAPLLEFFVINTIRLEKDKQDPEQLAWLAAALDRSCARWRILYGHHPLYSTGRKHGADLKLREKLEPMLLASYASMSSSPVAPATGSSAGRVPEADASGAGGEKEAGARVQVVFAGHDHIYQRFHPQNGVAYFVCGSSGQLRRGNAEPSPLVAAVEDQQRAFMLWEATPAELRYWAINEQGEAFDCGRLLADGTHEPVACPAAVHPESGGAGPLSTETLDSGANLE